MKIRLTKDVVFHPDKKPLEKGTDHEYRMFGMELCIQNRGGVWLALRRDEYEKTPEQGRLL